GAARAIFDLGNTTVAIGRNGDNKILGMGRGGRAAPFPPRSLAELPQGGGGGGGSGKARVTCSFLGIDFCVDRNGAGGGGGGGGAHPLAMIIGHTVIVEAGGAITGAGGHGGLGGGGWFSDSAGGGGGAGGNGSYILISANEVINHGELSTRGGLPGLSQYCPTDPFVGQIGLIDGELCGELFLVDTAQGEWGQDGVLDIHAHFAGVLPTHSGYSIAESADPWNQQYDFPFPGLADSDGDGLKDGLESWIGTRPDLADTDIDGLSDYDEVIETGTDPTLFDTDADGLSDGDELAANPYVTDPLVPDTDGDGIDDGLEIDKGSDPTNEFSTPEVCDGMDNDLDGTDDEDCEVRLDHKGREFFIPFLPNEGVGTTSLRLTVTSEGFADVTVEYPVGTTLETRSVTPDAAVLITIPSAAANDWPEWPFPLPTPIDPPVTSNTVRVTSTFDVAIVARNSEPGTRDEALALPTELLGQEYYVLTVKPDPSGFGVKSLFAVVATQDGTTVTIEGLAASLPSVNLDRGEGVLVRNYDDSSGTHVIANKKVVLANGNDCTRIPYYGGRYCSHVYEISLPVSRWGTEYAAAAHTHGLYGYAAVPQKRYLIVASQDGTTLSVNGSPWTVLDAGRVVELTPFAWPYSETLQFAHIEADAPIFGVQLMDSMCSAFPYDPGCPNSWWLSETVGSASMMNLIPAGRFPRLYRFQGPSTIKIIASTAAAQAEEILIDGTAVSSFAFEAFVNSPQWSVFTTSIAFPYLVTTSESVNGHALWLLSPDQGVSSTAPLGYDYDLPFNGAGAERKRK
ncbi:MAG: hypothetical protein KJO98_16955, partial [Rhodothermia bacterium]|nr:hypothetical protein [Rhodothermia bacterium]